jgi:hypothetical protein
MDLLRSVPEGAVQLVVTSPPYNIGKDYEKKVPVPEYTRWQETVIRSRRRFHEELKKLAAREFAGVVVGGSMRDVMEGAYGTGAHPNAVFGAAISICVDWGVPVYFCGDRQTARQFASRHTSNAARGPSTKATLGEAND